MASDVVALIPTYRPDADDLRHLLRALTASEVPVIVSDDGSPCSADAMLRDCASEPHTTVIRHRANVGVARGLNDGLAIAVTAGAHWLLTVDQDSVLASEYVARIVQAAHDAEEVLGLGSVGAIAAGGIADASGPLGYPVRLRDAVPITEEVIQTGTLWNVDALVDVGGFDETLGIDAVDAAACLNLRRSGRHVVLAPELTIEHRIGEGRQVRVLGRDVLASGHSPARRTTIVRNRLRLFPSEFAESPRHAIRTLRRVAVQTGLAVTIEEDRWAKAKASARGLLPPRDR